MSLRALFAYLSLADYDEAKRNGMLANLARYTRGNVLTQNGSVLDQPELEALIAAGDAAMKELRGSLQSNLH